MTPIERKARELLAAEYERGNWPNEARHIRENRLEAVEQFAIRAIATALRMGGEREEVEYTDDRITLTDVAGTLAELVDHYDPGERAPLTDDDKALLVDFVHGIVDSPLFRAVVGHYFMQNPPAEAKPEAVGEGGCACGNCGASSEYASTDVVAEAVAAWSRRFTDAGMPELPEPDIEVDGVFGYSTQQLHAYARDYAAANVAQATEALRAEVEALQFQCDRIHCEKVKALLRAERLAEVLRWYEGQVSGCRKIGSIGDPYRNALAADGGRRARAALHPQEADND